VLSTVVLATDQGSKLEFQKRKASLVTVTVICYCYHRILPQVNQFNHDPLAVSVTATSNDYTGLIVSLDEEPAPLFEE
jgi:hypothetical protein